MCLFTTRTTPIIAKEDITVYKLLNKVDGKYVSPYCYKLYRHGINKPYRDENWSEENSFARYLSSRYKVERGGLHAFQVEDEAESVAKTLLDGPEVMCFKMIIPKGSRYIPGQYSEICSDRLYWDINEPPVFVLQRESNNEVNVDVDKLCAYIQI